MNFHRTGLAMLVAAVATLVFIAPVSAAGGTYSSLSGDWTWHVQGLLRHAATKSPKWQSQRAAVERHIEDIGYLLQNASLAIRIADHAVAGINLRAAIRMLDRGVARGVYPREDVEPLKRIIAQQLSDNVRYDTGTVSQEGR